MFAEASPDGWEYCELGERIGRVVGGGTPSRNVPGYWRGDVPWASVKDFDDDKYLLTDTEEHISESGVANSATNLIEPHTPLICTRMAVGRAALAEVTVAINQDVKALYPKSNLTTMFLIHLLAFVRPRLESLSIGSTVKGLSVRDLMSLRISFPPVGEQRRIAEILNTADRAIEETEALIAKLRGMKTGLMHDLLTRGLDERGHLRDLDTHPEQFKHSPLGRIPRDWEARNLESISIKIQDGTHFSPQSKEGPFRYITSRNVRFGYLDLTGSGWIAAEEHKQIYARCDVRYGDVLLTKDGANTGNAAINTLSEPFSLLSSVALIRPREQHLSARFLLQYILSPATQKRLTDIVSGLAITRLTLEKIKALVIVAPSLREQHRIAEILDAHDARIRAEEAYRDKLKLQKKGLMDDLLTGKVRVGG